MVVLQLGAALSLQVACRGDIMLHDAWLAHGSAMMTLMINININHHDGTCEHRKPHMDAAFGIHIPLDQSPSLPLELGRETSCLRHVDDQPSSVRQN